MLALSLQGHSKVRVTQFSLLRLPTFPPFSFLDSEASCEEDSLVSPPVAVSPRQTCCFGSGGNCEKLEQQLYRARTVRGLRETLAFLVQIIGDSGICGKCVCVWGVSKEWQCQIIPLEHFSGVAGPSLLDTL